MKKDFRTSLGKARGLGSGKSGTVHFIRQRLTGLANVPLFILFILLVICLVGKDYASVHQVMANPAVSVFMGLMVVAGIYHMKLGVQVVIEDYISGHLLRGAMLALNIFFCFFLAAVCLLAVLKITLGG